MIIEIPRVIYSLFNKVILKSSNSSSYSANDYYKQLLKSIT